MDTNLIAKLHAEERVILDELRASLPFRRLEEIRSLLSLYAEQPPIGAGLDALLEAHRPPSPRRRAPQPAVIALHGERASA
jgi:predicted ATPase